MKIKIVADSSSNLLNLEGIKYSSVPLTIITNDKEYVDDENLDVNQMVKDLRGENIANQKNSRLEKKLCIKNRKII